MDRPCSVKYVLVANVQTDACFGLSWPFCAIFKVCGHVSEIAIFKKNHKKIRFFKSVNFFLMFFSVVRQAVHTHTKNLKLESCAFLKSFSIARPFRVSKNFMLNRACKTFYDI